MYTVWLIWTIVSLIIYRAVSLHINSSCCSGKAVLGWGLISILDLYIMQTMHLPLPFLFHNIFITHLQLLYIISFVWVLKTVQGSLCTVCCLCFVAFYFWTYETVMWVTCGHYSLSLCFHRQCHLLAEFALCANHLTSVSKIHVPAQSQIALKCFSVFL